MKPNRPIFLTLALTFGLVNHTFQLPIVGQQFLSQTQTKTPALKPPPTQPSQGKRTSGTGRGECPEVSLNLTALIPDTNVGWTIAEHPTFWFYIPYSPKLSLPVEFALVDGKDKDVYRSKPFLIKEQAGIISITIPKTVTPLEIGRRYKWSFSVICDRNHRDKDAIVFGRIQRVTLTPALKTQLEKADPFTKIALYGENSLWYEMLSNLAEMRRQNPQDKKINEDWANLLRSIELNDVATQSIRPCCSATDIQK